MNEQSKQHKKNIRMARLCSFNTNQKDKPAEENYEQPKRDDNLEGKERFSGGKMRKCGLIRKQGSLKPRIA